MNKRPTRAFCGDLDEEVEPSQTAFTVHESERDDFTGIYDATGRPIYRPRIKLGFVGRGNKS